MNYLNADDKAMIERMDHYVELVRLKGADKRKANKVGTVKALILDKRNGMQYRWVVLSVVMRESVWAPIGTLIAAVAHMDGQEIVL